MTTHAAQEETPGGNPASVSDPLKGTNEMTVSAPTVKSESDNALVRFDTRRAPTIMEIADAEKYANYTTQIALLPSAHDRLWTDPIPEVDGAFYRFAVIIRVFPSSETFRILLRPGAGPEDLEFAERQLRDIRDGRFNQFPWITHDSKKNPGTVYYGVSLGEPMLETDAPRHRWLEACTVEACVEKMHERWHVEDEPMHTAERTDDGTVSVIRFDGAWAVSLNIGNDSDLSPEDATSLANDLRWAAATCAKLNAPKAVA